MLDFVSISERRNTALIIIDEQCQFIKMSSVLLIFFGCFLSESGSTIKNSIVTILCCDDAYLMTADPTKRF